MVALILAAIIAVAAAMGGVVVASDSAAPGDALYGVDRTVESIRVKMARGEARTALLMELAKERLQEAGDADEDNVDAALEEYMAALDELLNAVIESGEADPEQLAALLEALDNYEEQLRAILDDLEEGGDDTPGDVPDDGEDDQNDHDDGDNDQDDPTDGDDNQDDPDDGDNDQGDPNDGDDDQNDPDDEQDEESSACVGANPHPVVMALSQSYGYEYDEIISWFCSGYGLGEIKHALAAESAMATGEDDEDGDQNGGYTAEEILALKSELGGWGQVWQHLGRIGKGRNPHNISDPGDRELRAPDEPTVEGDDAADDEPQSPVAEPTAEPQDRPGNGNGSGNGNGNGNGNGRGNGNNGNNGRGNGNIPPGHREDGPGNGKGNNGNNGNGNGNGNGRGNGRGRGR